MNKKQSVKKLINLNLIFFNAIETLAFKLHLFFSCFISKILFWVNAILLIIETKNEEIIIE